MNRSGLAGWKSILTAFSSLGRWPFNAARVESIGNDSRGRSNSAPRTADSLECLPLSGFAK